MFSLRGYSNALNCELESMREAYYETSVDSTVDLLLVFMHKLKPEVAMDDLVTTMDQVLDVTGKDLATSPPVPRMPDTNAFLVSLRDPETGEIRPNLETINLYLRGLVLCAITTFGGFPDVLNDESAFRNAINVTLQRFTVVWRKRAALWIAHSEEFDQFRRNAIRPWTEKYCDEQP